MSSVNALDSHISDLDAVVGVAHAVYLIVAQCLHQQNQLAVAVVSHIEIGGALMCRTSPTGGGGVS